LGTPPQPRSQTCSKRGGSHYGSPHVLWISRRRVNPRAASDAARGETCRHCSTVPEGLLCSSRTF